MDRHEDLVQAPNVLNGRMDPNVEAQCTKSHKESKSSDPGDCRCRLLCPVMGDYLGFSRNLS